MTLVLDTTPSLSPISLPRLSEAEVQRKNTLLGSFREFPFNWAGKSAALSFIDAASARAPTGWVRVRLGDHSLDVGIPSLPEPSSLGAAFAGIEIAALPEDLVVGVLEAWLDEPLQALKQQGVHLELEAWSSAPRASEADLGWHITWDGQTGFLSGVLSANAESLGFLAGLAHRRKPQPRVSADLLSFAGAVAIASTQLPLNTLRGLSVGDVVLVPLSAADRANGYCEVWLAGRRLAAARRVGETLTLSRMNVSTDSKTPAGSPSASLQVDELPVQLLFDVGQIDVSVGLLRTLGEGHTFQLPSAPANLVTIRANGREIGQGELVEIGEKMGVRIVSWSLS